MKLKSLCPVPCRDLLCIFIDWWRCPLRLGWLAVWIQVVALCVNMTAITITWKRQGMPRQLQWLLDSIESTFGQSPLSPDAVSRKPEIRQTLQPGDDDAKALSPPCAPRNDEPSQQLPSPAVRPTNADGCESMIQSRDRLPASSIFLHNDQVVARRNGAPPAE